MRQLLLLLIIGLLRAGLAHADTAREAQLCGGAEDPEQAFAACNRLLATSPSDFRYRADIVNSRGVARAMLGDLNGAIDDFSLAIRNWPNHSDAYNNRGFTYAKLGQLEQARNDFEMALSSKYLWLQTAILFSWAKLQLKSGTRKRRRSLD